MSSIHTPLPRGFQWAATKAGIKASGRTDLAIAVADQPCTAAVLYTTNQVVAAPLIVGREHVAATGGQIRAVVVNAGNANCATGPNGITAARETCAAMANLIGCNTEEILPSSTGIIGVPLPVEKLIAALPNALTRLSSGSTAAEDFATAIMTTDTRMKCAQAEFIIAGDTVRLFGCCKGAGMIGPQLGMPLRTPSGPPHATLLVYLFTDLAIDATALQTLLSPAVEQSFNSISVDGDTSTNDTVLLLSSGASGKSWNQASTSEQQQFEAALHRLCHTLAHSIIDDGEGVTHVVNLRISGAPDDSSAKQIAKSIAHSPLCKTAWSSADPNWGRVLAAAGYAGVPFDPANVSIRIGEYLVFEHGTRSPTMNEAAVHQRMLDREYDIAIDLGTGPGQCRFLTCDLTVEYVHINADYST